MTHLSVSELLLYGGIGIMAVAALLAAAGILVFSVTGRKIKSRLEEDYGRELCRD